MPIQMGVRRRLGGLLYALLPFEYHSAPAAGVAALRAWLASVRFVSASRVEPGTGSKPCP
jgi:hypothetical protein